MGRATLGTNYTEFTSRSSKQIDYWIAAGDTPSDILTSYMEVVGKPPMMPEYGLGFWQCKLRYQTQEELLSVAREYHRRNIPVNVIVVDFFHWTQQGDWQFDKRYWPDPKAMTEELDQMGMKLMVSVWPTVDRNSVHYREMEERDLLVRVDRGLAVTMDCWGFEQFFDATRKITERTASPSSGWMRQNPNIPSPIGSSTATTTAPRSNAPTNTPCSTPVPSTRA